MQEEDIQLLGEDVLRRRKRRLLSPTKLVTVTCFIVLLLLVIVLVVVPCVFVLLWAPREASLPILPSPNCSSGCKYVPTKVSLASTFLLNSLLD